MKADGRRRFDPRPFVWVVEDDPMYRDTITELILASQRFRDVQQFGDGESAIATLDQGDDLPQLILMDIALPGMSGTHCVRLVRARIPAVPVIMLTVHQSNDRIFEAVCAGASGYLLKSTPGEEIVQAMQRVLTGGAVMDAQIARRVLDMFTDLVEPRVDYGLSEREAQTLQLLVDGLSKNQIAGQLRLSPHTIDSHIRNIYTKLHVNNRSGAVAKALKENLL